MFKKLIAIALTSTVATSALARTFYSVEGSQWDVEGVTSENNFAPACTLIKRVADGSEFRLIFDLNDGEKYLLIHNTVWNIADEINKSYTLRMNFHGTDGKVQGTAYAYELLNKNTIRLRQLSWKFVNEFQSAKEFRLILPGTIENVVLSLAGSRDAITKRVADCVVGSEKIKDLHTNRPAKDQSRLPQGAPI